MGSNKRTYFVSDIHLGASSLSNNIEREKLFVKWLSEIQADASELFLMGDIFDYWFEYKKVVPRGFTRTLAKIADFTDNGIPVHFFTGNHDVWVFDYLPAETGVVVHREPLETQLMGKKFFLAHGDGLDESDKSYRFLKKIFTSRIAQKLYSWLHPNMTMRFAQRWSKHSRTKRADKPDVFTPGEDGIYRFAASVLENRYFDYFIFGHRHHMVNLPIGDKSRFILLGDWISHFSYGVFDGNNFELKKYN